MIEIDREQRTYTCPFCRMKQAYLNSCSYTENGNYQRTSIPIQERDSIFGILTIHCTNKDCQRYSVVAFNRTSSKQVDIYPQNIVKKYPEYIPIQIRKDYEEALQIVDVSPRASATLLRRCLQGMIHDFWNIHEKNLNAEITALKDKVTTAQWHAIDGIRTMGNIGAHMEQDVNNIIDIEPYEAKALLELIELLFERWYISRHDEEVLCKTVVAISQQKEHERDNLE